MAKIAPDDAVMLYEGALSSLEEYLKAKPEEGYQHWINGTEEMIPILAKEPKRLVRVVECVADSTLHRGILHLLSLQKVESAADPR